MRRAVQDVARAARQRARLAAAALLAVGGVLVACARGGPAPGAPNTQPAPPLADRHATAETRALFANLHALSGRGVLFGHQETLAYGTTWRNEPGRSDVKDASGSYPAVYGWDANALFDQRPGAPGRPGRVDQLRGWILEGYGRGGVITMSWHVGNPVTGRDAWDTTAAVAQLLPGGTHHAAWLAKLDTLADFFRALRTPNGELVPVIFRPFHETTGGWFWWGRRHATAAEYSALWRETVEHLRDRRGVHNLLWAYSTDVFASPADYLDRYPGDAYVDVLGFDDYQSVRSPATRDTLVRRLHDVATLAVARGKLAALTETGVEAVPDSLWWTGTLLPALAADSLTRRVSWALVWRNANPVGDRAHHFFAPYAGHPSAPDFRRFRDDPFVRFEDELPPLYHADAARPVDAAATAETRALFTNLRGLAGRRVLVGHHDDLAYGYGWRAEPGRSDVREAAGAYPAVYGWDLSRIESGSTVNIDSVDFGRMRGWIAEGFRRGGVITVSWHAGNPVSGGNAWDTTAAVAAILPGGARHAEYRAWLDRVAAYVGSLRATGPDGRVHPVPVVFRPFHEMSGAWFWWGARHATPAEYVALWRFTVDYLRGPKGVHNLLYAYSPDVFASDAEYLARYPGDAYVDVLGFDDYQSVKSPATREVLVRRLGTVAALADARGKVAAFTETGVESVPDSTWWTGTLLPALDADALTRRVAWVSLWRNAPRSAAHPHHFFAPYAGQASAADFARFRRDPRVAFDGDVPTLYRAPGAH